MAEATLAEATLAEATLAEATLAEATETQPSVLDAVGEPSIAAPASAPPVVSVVVVTYQSRRHLPDLVQSLRSQTFHDFELIQIDSASKDGSNAVLSLHWPGLRQTASPENLGYRRGNQLGIQQARGEYIVVMNDDVELHPRLLEELVDAARREERVAIVAPAILVYGDSTRVNAAGSDLLPVGFYAARGKDHPFQGLRRPRGIAAASGCCFLVRRDFLERSGGFAPVFDTLPSGWHASLEDLDLCWRAWAEGWRVVYQPKALLWHKYTQKGLDVGRFASLVGGRLVFVWMNFPGRFLARFAPVLSFTELALLCWSCLRGPRFVRAWATCWHWAWRNRRRLNELRRVRHARRVASDATLLGLFSHGLVAPPGLRRSWPLRAALRAWFAGNALCLGWPFRRAGLAAEQSPATPSPQRPYLGLKRLGDVVSATLLLILLAPIFCLLALLVRLQLGRPVLFRQTRIGRNDQPFTLYKFRSMLDDQDRDGRPRPDAERLPPFGQWLRGWSLDELPQLWNVLRGDMSFVGPRPLLPEYLPRYSAEHRLRHALRPGLSGLAQVNGRNRSSWRKRLDLDCEYVRSVSLALDLQIAWMTVGRLLRRDGIAHESAATMPEFQGLPHDA